ncbi:MAG: photosystem II biogenesis protein Psp29 [Chloroflexaceae bacterium]|nr:photosystem II biogenesis protein Psp29 [Chloroflexaceae bacterium]
MNKVRTVSDTKRDFYTYHARPINSIYRRVVEELMVEMHLLSVNRDFRPDPIYHLGVVATFDRFMQGYRPEQDVTSMFSALCRAIGKDPQQYRESAERVLEAARRFPSPEDLIQWLKSPQVEPGAEQLAEAVQDIAKNPDFKYSRLFGSGLYVLLETVDPQAVNEEQRRNELLTELAIALNLSGEKLKKDLEFYRSNLEKLDQLLLVLQDALEAGRKKREQPVAEPSEPINPGHSNGEAS